MLSRIGIVKKIVGSYRINMNWKETFGRKLFKWRNTLNDHSSRRKVIKLMNFFY